MLASRAASVAALRAGASTTHHRSRLRDALVAGEVALAVMLLAGAALLIRSFERLRAVDPGFRAEGAVMLPLSHAEKGAAEFHAEVARRVSAIPGVRAAGATLNLPMGGSIMAGDITLEGRPGLPDASIAQTQVAAGDYFRAGGLTLPDPPFLDEVVIRFGVSESDGHYHVPLLVSPFAYSTYRGS